jgi:hypothetical protein
MTYAERSAAAQTRDDEHMIYEMYQFSQYEDGSVFDCVKSRTYTAEELLRADVEVGYCQAKYHPSMRRRLQAISGDLRRNAKAALKNGKTENRTPFVNW